MRHCNRSTRKRITRRLFLLTRVHQAARKHETLVNPSCSLRNLSFLDYSDSFPNSSHLKVKIVQGPWLKARYVGIVPVYMFQFAAWNSLYNMCHNKSTYFNRFNIFQVLCVCASHVTSLALNLRNVGTPYFIAACPIFWRRIQRSSHGLKGVWSWFWSIDGAPKKIHRNAHHTSHTLMLCSVSFLHCGSVWNFQHALSLLIDWSS